MFMTSGAEQDFCGRLPDPSQRPAGERRRPHVGHLRRRRRHSGSGEDFMKHVCVIYALAISHYRAGNII